MDTIATRHKQTAETTWCSSTKELSVVVPPTRSWLALVSELPGQRRWIGSCLMIDARSLTPDAARELLASPVPWDEKCREVLNWIVLRPERTRRRREVFDAETEMEFGTTPWKHQVRFWAESRDAEFWALLMDMGTGKTKVTIDTAAWLWQHGRIEAVVVVAPKAVAVQWADEEIPKHLPPWVDAAIVRWDAWTRAAKSRREPALATIREPGNRLLFVTTGFAIVRSKRDRRLFDELLDRHRTLLVVDESSKIKTPSAATTRALWRMGRRAAYRRILTGQPVWESPTDCYSQFQFLSWGCLGAQNVDEFKARYVVREPLRGWDGKTKKDRSGRDILVEVGSKNLGELRQRISRISSQIRRHEAVDIPPKTYVVRNVELSREQRRLYAELADSIRAEIRAGSIATLRHAAIRVNKLRQVLTGFVRDDEGEWQALSGRNPKLDELLDVLDETTGQAIVWGAFNREVQAVVDALGDEVAVPYSGAYSDEVRERSLRRFRAGEARVLVGIPQAGGWGLNLAMSSTTVYLSSPWSLEARLQSEARQDRAGQTAKRQLFVDVVAEGTIDERVIEALRRKEDLAGELTLDRVADLV